ncbi:MAG: CHAT domain-containing protein [Cyanobacteria bacterium P01_F01_bin.13]
MIINLGRHTLIGPAALLAVLLLKFSQTKSVQAQVITPATDGTGTIVTESGQSFDIDAGSLSADGRNLFHSFRTFQLTSGTTVNFLADPSIQRIFARIKGDNAAFINGNLQITGAPADLFLLNPAGIIFGPNVTLNLPANLTATAGNRINFNDGAFKAVNPNNYETLVGSPTAFIFDQSGIIRNQGNLTLLPGQTLTLLGGSVINNGELIADNIQIREITEEQTIQVSQTGSLLNLEFSGEAFRESSPDGNLTPSMLPGLLTNGEPEQAGQIVNTPDGQLLLTNASPSTAPLPETPRLPGPSGILTRPSPNVALPQPDIVRSHNPSFRHSNNPPANNQPSKPQAHQSSPPPELAQHHIHRAVLDIANASAAIEAVEELRSQEFSDYFGRDLGAQELTLPEIQHLLTDVYTYTGNQSVIVYVKTPKLATDIVEKTSTTLELLVFQSTGDPIKLVIPEVDQGELFRTVEQFRHTLVASSRAGSKRYLPSAQKLYQWIIKPIEDELGPNAIDTILFSMDSGLRSLPIAALHDGKQFLIEKYSVGMVPSLGLMDPHYRPLMNAQVLAMGASDFKSLQPLPAVPAEIETIGQLWPSRKFLNEAFTQQNLIRQQQRTPAQIIHLATHAEFSTGNADDSYIQLWDERLRLSDIHTLGWDNPTVDLLVLSACRTALGNRDAEMGFAGLAVAAGVKSALASLWTVSDVGTLALMSEFYHQLMDTSVKSDALRAAQLAMLKGETRFEEKQLPIMETQLPVEVQENLDYLDLSHPFYWAGFTLIGSPW